MKRLNRIFSLSLLVIAFLFIQCKKGKEVQKNNSNQEQIDTAEKSAGIKVEEYGTTPDGETVEQYTLTNTQGVEVKIITYGGRITSLKTPDKNGKMENIVLSFDTLDKYLADNPYFGAIIGRYGNRIKEGKFSLDGKDYKLATNDGPNHLHGGNKGFDRVVWKATPIDSLNALVLTYKSKDQEEGYPGNLDIRVTYSLDDDNALKISYEAQTDKTTIINLTNHSYFNLSGDLTKKILPTAVKINADKYLPVNETLIPTGKLQEVEGTPFDFRKEKPIAQDIGDDNEQLKRGSGYDHCWVLNDQDQGLRWVASAFDSDSGRKLDVYTTEPGLQFYTGNSISNDLPLSGAGKDKKRIGFAMETEHYPDSPNQKDFPSVELKPGETYSSETIYKFSIK